MLADPAIGGIVIPRRVIEHLRVIAHIRIGVHPLQIALHTISREEETHFGIVIACAVVIQLCGRIMVLPSEAFVGAKRAGFVRYRAGGAVDTVGLHCGTARQVAKAHQHTAQRIGEQHARATGRQFADQASAQTVVVSAALQVAGAIVEMFFQSEGIDCDGGRTSRCGSLQDAIATGVVGIPRLGLVARCGVIPLDEVVQQVIGERGRIGVAATAQCARDDVAPRIIGGGVHFA